MPAIMTLFEDTPFLILSYDSLILPNDLKSVMNQICEDLKNVDGVSQVISIKAYSRKVRI